MPNILGRRSETVKTGNEQFHSKRKDLGYDLRDFWRWSVSDLVSNMTRGRLAEFIVAKALGIATETVRDEWGAFDLLMMPEKLKVEVKSAAFIQSWAQSGFSRITFLTTKTRERNPDTNLMSRDIKRQADVYVFALLAEKDKDKINPLDVSQWNFYVLPTAVLNTRTRSQHSITLTTLDKLASGSVEYAQLADAVRRAGEKPSGATA